MYKIGIIGERNSILGFMALGFSVHEVKNADEAAQTLQRLAASGEYAIIYILEGLARALGEELAQYKDSPLPAVTVIPDSSGSKGYGTASLKAAVERAVGADIIFKD